jgi:hypothetical protein
MHHARRSRRVDRKEETVPLRPDELADILRSARQRPPEPPAPLLDWLRTFVHAFLDGLPRDRPDPPTAAEVATAAVAGVYGPRREGPPSEEVFRYLVGQARFRSAADLRAVERLLVLGAGQRHPDAPGGSGPWFGAWPGSLDALLRLLRACVREPLAWLRREIERSEARRDPADTYQEEAALAVLLRQALLRGCDCWTRWQDLRIHSEEDARQRCRRAHRLDAWESDRQSLGDFLAVAVEGGGRLAAGQCNAFRHGMLAKVACDGRLHAGPVLRCHVEGCRGEVQFDNRCDGPGRHLAQVREPSWWLWLADGPGQRTEWTCWRCKQCGDKHGRLYFRSGRGGTLAPACPLDHTGSWSRRPVEVWVPAGLMSLEDAPRLATPGEAPDHQLLEEEERESLLRLVRGWPEGELKTVALALCEAGGSEEEAARRVGMESCSDTFQQLLRQIRERLPTRPVPGNLGGKDS